MIDVKATELPEGSVVANDKISLFRVLPGIGMVWHGTDKKRYDDGDINQMFAVGAVVLREGYGD